MPNPNPQLDSFVCDNLGSAPVDEAQEGGKISCSILHSYLLRATGEAPRGSYFWQQPSLRAGWQLQFCYDINNPEHVNYAQSCALAMPRKWSEVT